MVVIMVGDGEESVVKSPHLAADANTVAAVACSNSSGSSKKKEQDIPDIANNSTSYTKALKNHRCSSPLQNGIEPDQQMNGDVSEVNSQASIDQTSAFGKRGIFRPAKFATPTAPGHPMANGLGGTSRIGLNYNHKTSSVVNAKNKSTTLSFKDQYTLSSETYDLDFPPSITSGLIESSSTLSSGKISEKVAETSEEKENILSHAPKDSIPPESAPSSTQKPPTGAPLPISSSSRDCETATNTPSFTSSNISTPPPTTTDTTSVGDKNDIACAVPTKIANGPRKKGNKAKWVPIQITRAPFRDEFFSATQGPSTGAPKPGFGPASKRDGNGPPANLSSARRPQPGPNNASNNSAFRRQSSQYGGAQARGDCATLSSSSITNKQSPEHVNLTTVNTEEPGNDTTISLKGGAANQRNAAAACVTSLAQAVTSQSSPSTIVPNKTKSGDGCDQAGSHLTNDTPSNYNPSSPPVRSSSSSSKPTANGPTKVGIGSSTLPRRPGQYPNQRISGSSSRVSQTMGEGAGPAPYTNHHHIAAHNVPLFAGHPGLTRLHLNGHPLPAYISPTAHQHASGPTTAAAAAGPFQIPLMAPYPYDNEAYYNYNTVLAHPFFTTHHPHHHPPHMYYRSIATTPGLPILPPHSAGIVNTNNNLTGLLPLAPMPAPNSSNQQRWNGETTSNNNNNPTSPPDLGSVAPKVSSQHIRSNSVAAVGYTQPSQNAPPSEPQVSGPPPLTDKNTVVPSPMSENSTVDKSVPERAPAAASSAPSSTVLVPKQQNVTNVRSKSETSAVPGIAKDPTPQPPPQTLIPNLPSLMTALPPPQPLAPILTPTGPAAHYYAQNSSGPGPLIGPPLAPVPPAILVAGPPEPSPIIVLTGAGGHPVSPQFNVPLVDQLRKQIEYYFSEENLVKDLFLRRNMDTQGFIPLSLIATFHRVKMLTSDIYLIRQAIKLSTEVDFVNDRVRTKHNPTIWPITLAPQQPPPNPALVAYAQTTPLQAPLGTPIAEQSSRIDSYSQFPFPSSTNAQIPPRELIAPSPLSQDDMKLLATLLKRDRATPLQLADSMSPRYFCRYLTSKSYSLPDLSNLRPYGRTQLIRSRPDGKTNLDDCVIVTPTEQLTTVLRPDPDSPYFKAWKECKSVSLHKIAERLTQILTTTFFHLNTTQLPFDRLSPLTTSTRGERCSGRKRCNSFPSLQTPFDPSSFLPKFSVCTEPSALVWCYETQPPSLDLAHDSSPKQRGKTNPGIISGLYGKKDGLTPGLDLLELLKHEGWITFVPYNTLLQNLANNDASGLEATLKSLYAFWSQLMNPQTDQNLLDSFRETVFKYPEPRSAYRFGIDRLLETYTRLIDVPSSQRENFLPKIISDLSRMIQNGGISIEDAKTWVFKSLFPPLNSTTRLRLKREIPFLHSDDHL